MKTKLQSIFAAAGIAIVLFSLPGCSAGAQPAGTGTGCPSREWTVLKTITFNAPTLSTIFRDEAFGVTTDLGGEIYYTEDGGGTWTDAARSGLSRVALEISGDSIWQVGFGGSLTRSVDDAHTWQVVGPLPHTRFVEYISFADGSNGWAATTDELTYFITRDSGQSWETLPLPEGMDTVAALHLRTPADGYLLDTAGSLFVTADGGGTWERRSLGLEEGWTIPGLVHTAAMRFTDEDHGLVVLNLVKEGPGRVFALRTEDGGATWAQESLPVPMGMFHLTRDGVTLTHVDLLDHSKITVLCAQP